MWGVKALHKYFYSEYTYLLPDEFQSLPTFPTEIPKTTAAGQRLVQFLPTRGLSKASTPFSKIVNPSPTHNRLLHPPKPPKNLKLPGLRPFSKNYKPPFSISAPLVLKDKKNSGKTMTYLDQKYSCGLLTDVTQSAFRVHSDTP